MKNEDVIRLKLKYHFDDWRKCWIIHIVLILKDINHVQ